MGIARELEWQREENSAAENRILQKRIRSLTHDLPPLPDFSRFHPSFHRSVSGDTPGGRHPYRLFHGTERQPVRIPRIDNGEMQRQMKEGRVMVSTTFVIPTRPVFRFWFPDR